MNDFQYTIIVRTDTQEHADQVVRERIYYEEDYGFEYSIAEENFPWSPPIAHDYGGPTTSDTANALIEVQESQKRATFSQQDCGCMCHNESDQTPAKGCVCSPLHYPVKT